MGKLRNLFFQIGGQPKRTFLLWPLVWALVIPAIMIAGDASPLGPDFAWVMLSTPILLFLGLTASFFASIVVVRSIWKKLWPNAVSASLLPIVVLVVACKPFGFIRLCNHIGNAVNLSVTQSRYMQLITNLPADSEPKLVVFNRGGMIWSSEGFIYDEADEVALPPAQQSAKWKARAESVAELSCGPYEAIAFWDHFYYGGFSC